MANRFKSSEEFVNHFNAMEPGAVIPGTGRYYTYIGGKGDAKLYLCVQLQTRMTKVGPVIHVACRFSQVGGEPDSFAPPLKVRGGGERLMLSKTFFPFLKVSAHVSAQQIAQAWTRQNTMADLRDWVKGLCASAGAKVKDDAYLADVISAYIPLPDEEIEAGDCDLFSLDVKFDDDEKKAVSGILASLYDNDDESTDENDSSEDDSSEDEDSDSY